MKEYKNSLIQKVTTKDIVVASTGSATGASVAEPVEATKILNILSQFLDRTGRKDNFVLVLFSIFYEATKNCHVRYMDVKLGYFIFQ
jgi:hypothetical protein